MSTALKFILYLITLVVVLVVVLAIVIKVQVTPEKVRETLLPLAEETLDREIDFGAVQIGLFSGISVADLKVMQKGSKDPFFAVASVGLHYQLWPLLRGQVVIDEILLDRPEINISRFPDGQFNFSDLLNTSRSTPTSSRDPKKVTSAPTAARLPLNLLVKEVNLRDGQLLYVDRYKNSKAPFRYTLKKLNFKARQITLDDSFPVDLSAIINGSNIDISGHYDFSTKTGDLTVHLAPLDVVQFAPYYRDSLPGKLGSAQLSVRVDVDLQPEMVTSKGKVNLDNVDLVLDDYRDSAISAAAIGADYAFEYHFDKQQLTLSTLLFHYNNVQLGAEGEIDFSAAKPFLVFSLLFDHLDLREVMQNLPEKLSRRYQRYSIAGLIDGRIDFAGRADSGLDLLKAARLTLSDVQASTEGLRAGVSGDISYTNKVLQTDNLQLEYAGQKLLMRLQAEKMDDGLYHGDFDLAADTLDLNAVLPHEEAPAVAAEEPPRNTNIPVTREKTVAEDIGPYDIPVAMSGTLAVKHLLYKKLDISNVAADVDLRDNRLAVTNLQGTIGRGAVSAQTLVDLGVKGLAYSGQLNLVQPDVTPLLAGLFPLSEKSVSGQLQLNSNFSGRGTLQETLLHSLRLNGHFNLEDGVISGSTLLSQLAKFLGHRDLKVLNFKQFAGDYSVANGVVDLNSRLLSSKTRLETKGSMSLNGMLNTALLARFSPAVIDKLHISDNVKRSLSDRDGWVDLPLKIGGTVDHPQFSYDTAMLQQQLVDKASRKLLEKIAPEGDENAEPLREMLDNTLNKLFGQ